MCWHRWVNIGQVYWKDVSQCEHVKESDLVQKQHCTKCHAEREVDAWGCFI